MGFSVLCTFTFRLREMTALCSFYPVMEHVITRVRATGFLPYRAHKGRISDDN